ncbi:MAG: arabinoxylan arabinofuranohydrolase [Verrucomicrobiota bacterium]|nr:arabinoxylan arabinofuranohydrolase [Verrucomicrobiota bacterium]
MKNSSVLPLVLWFASFATFLPLRADYPIASHRHLADPGSLVHEGRVYLYCSNDNDSPLGGGYAMQSIVCVSSRDLKNWTDHGEIFRVPVNASWATYSWAPAVIARNGHFYLYFGNGGSGIGVATSASPTGPFTAATGGTLINASTPGASGPNMWLFDPAVFLDDDGQAYLYFGGNGDANARVIKLNSDMISVSGPALAMTVPNFFEASWLHKRNGVYYFSYSTNPANGLRIDYLTSSSPTSGFVYRGIAAGQPPSNNNNNHHAIFSLNGSWYHAYHNRYVATQAGIATTYRRNLGLERLEHNGDGTLQPITYATNSLTQLLSVDPFTRNEAEAFNAQSGIATGTCSEGGMAITEVTNGTWIKVAGVDFGSTGAGKFNVRVASATSGGIIELRLDNHSTGPLIGTCSVAGTGGWQTWTTVSCAITVATGVHDLFLKFTGGSSPLMSLNSWQFDPSSSSGPTAPSSPSTGSNTPAASGGSSGGGAPSLWFISTLCAISGLRILVRKRLRSLP